MVIQEKYDLHTLPNGMRIIGERMDSFRSLALGLFVRTGSVNESAQESGYSHFIEHMAFKGTTHKNARQIADEMDGLGGNTNAYTTKEMTCLYTKVLAEHMEKGFGLLGDLLLRPALPVEEIEREKGVILEEIAMCEDNPEDLVHELLNTAQWEGHVIGAPILGTVDSVCGVTREKLISFIDKHYTPANTVLAIAGRYDWEQIVARAQAEFGAWERKAAQVLAPMSQPESPNRHIVREKDTEQVQICIGYPGVDGASNDNYPLSILMLLFGGCMSSRLFQRIREQNGLAYSVFATTGVYSGAGDVALYVGTSEENAQKAIDLMAQEVHTLLADGVSEAEFNRAVNQVKIAFVMGVESVTARMRTLGNSLSLYNRARTDEEVLQLLENTTIDDVNAMAHRVFDKPYCTAVVGMTEQPLSFATFEPKNKA